MTLPPQPLPFRTDRTPPVLPGPPTVRRSGRRRRPPGRWRVALAVLLVAALVPAGISYARALTYPGRASFLVRTVEWVRDHGGAPVVNLAENVYYTVFNAPTGSRPAASSLPAPAATPVSTTTLPAELPITPGFTPLPGEGRWTAVPGPHGAPSGVTTTFVRPDRDHGSVVAGVAHFDQNVVATRLIPGTREPSGTGWPEHGEVPPALLPSLVATFNSGWKMKDANGGFLADGVTAVPLQDGAASMVIGRDGRVTVGQWGREVGPGPGVVAVRQNLELVVDGGRPVDGLGSNANGRWGSSHNQLQYTWRSGAGVTADGSLVYVAGNKLDLTALAAALTQAGAVTGMQLDIHSGMADLFTYRHQPGGPPVPTTLLPDMPVPNDRYLVPDQRDFFAVTVRPGQVNASH